MTEQTAIVNRVDAAIKRNGGDIPHLLTEIDRLVDQFGYRTVIDALAQCAAIAYLRLPDSGAIRAEAAEEPAARFQRERQPDERGNPGNGLPDDPDNDGNFILKHQEKI